MAEDHHHPLSADPARTQITCIGSLGRLTILTLFSTHAHIISAASTYYGDATSTICNFVQSQIWLISDMHLQYPSLDNWSARPYFYHVLEIELTTASIDHSIEVGNRSTSAWIESKHPCYQLRNIPVNMKGGMECDLRHLSIQKRSGPFPTTDGIK